MSIDLTALAAMLPSAMWDEEDIEKLRNKLFEEILLRGFEEQPTSEETQFIDAANDELVLRGMPQRVRAYEWFRLNNQPVSEKSGTGLPPTPQGGG